MEGIEFDTEKYKPLPSMQGPAKKSWAIRLVMKLSGGRIKTDEQASKVLAVFVVILFLFSFYNFFFSNKKTVAPKINPAIMNITTQ